MMKRLLCAVALVGILLIAGFTGGTVSAQADYCNVPAGTTIRCGYNYTVPNGTTLYFSQSAPSGVYCGFDFYRATGTYINSTAGTGTFAIWTNNTGVNVDTYVLTRCSPSYSYNVSISRHS